MILVVEEIVKAQDVLLLHITIVVDVREQLDLVEGLIDVVLGIVDDLHAVLLTVLEIEHLHSPGELSLPQHRENLVATGYHIINDDLEWALADDSVVLVEHNLQVEDIVDHSIVLHRIEFILGVGELQVARELDVL